MSRDWTRKELEVASEAMKSAGCMGCEDFCIEMERQSKEDTCCNAPDLGGNSPVLNG